ncbi:tRNA (uracil-5-)-methyltransferase [Enterococcus hulanensis]|uniref:tRNA (uracil-5-)-methyltransferase n=1 Tax=Enterococcus hulanensis TaxID=2559929 RepID=UPI0010F6F2F9|nr:tRNA (uracil-5-)-methyltransferase [Enterococcus hulanensis]
MKKKTIISAIVLVIVLVCGYFLFQYLQQEEKLLADVESAEEWTGERQVSREPSPTIEIPGFDSIPLKADSTQQQVNFHNPKSNTCYFKLSLWRDPDTKLWESKLLEPGKAIYDLTLNQAVAAGKYDQAMLKYECFTLDKQEPLNGSEINLTLNVQ